VRSVLQGRSKQSDDECKNDSRDLVHRLRYEHGDAHNTLGHNRDGAESNADAAPPTGPDSWLLIAMIAKTTRLPIIATSSAGRRRARNISV
jgi:hypothetical protein